MDQDKLLVGFTGDVMIGRGVNEVITRNGYAYPWGDLLPLLTSTDINIINLETTLTTSQQRVRKIYNFKASPDKIQTLIAARISLASLANNHILDYSEAGLLETIYLLEEAGIHHTGAGPNAAAATRPAILVKNNIRLGMLGLTDNEPRWKAGPHSSGTNFINVLSAADREQALAAVGQLRPKVDVLLVSIHWGPNMQQAPAPAFVDFAHQLIDAGTDLIHGHSAHIFQAIEVYKNKLILYDTGDFVDDYVVDPVLKNDHSFFFLTEIGKQGVERLRLIPVLICHNQVNHAPEAAYRWCIARMQHLCARFNTRIKEDGLVLLPPVPQPQP